MKGITKFAYISLFCIICIMTVASLGIKSILRDNENHENRQLNGMPVFSFENYLNYSSEFDKYFDDNIPFRSTLIMISSAVDYLGFGVSPNPDVIIGKDGWLFYSAELGDYRKTNLYSDKELGEITGILAKTKQYFDEQGIEFIIFIPPDKATVYADRMPDNVNKLTGLSRTEQIVDYIRTNTDIRIVFPQEEMISAATEHQDLCLYYKTDTHWNHLGGFFGCNALLRELNIQPNNFEEAEYTEINKPAYEFYQYDLINMMGLSRILKKDVNYDIKTGNCTQVVYEADVSSDQEAYSSVYETYSDAKDGRTVYFARDSFGEGMMQYLAENFKRVISVNHPAISLEQIEKEKPDVFIYELVERNGLEEIDFEKWK